MILSTLDIRRTALKKAVTFLWITIFCVFFGAVYEHYSHQVYSYYMIYAFVFPLIGGVLPWLTLSFHVKIKMPGAICRNEWHAGIATCTVGSIFQGIIEIYGTTSPYTKIYWILGITLLFLGLLSYIIELSGGKES